MKLYICLFLILSTGFLFSQEKVPDFFRLTNESTNFQNATFTPLAPLWETYLDWYGFNRSTVVRFRAGHFSTTNFQLMAYEFLPAKTIGTVVLIHGYLSHTGDFSLLINFLTKLHYRVLAFDLPGHGLSGGDRTAINHFSDYLTAYTTFLSVVSNDIQYPLFFIGHSTGCAADLEFLSQPHKNYPFEAHIWLAPLVRISSWQLAAMGSFILTPITRKIPRPFIPASSNAKFNRFIEYLDPLQPKIISTTWFNALSEWDKTNQNYNNIHDEIVIIQGTADNVVDWHYNLSYYTNRLKNFEVHFIPHAKHHLAVEAPKYRKKVFKIIKKTLAQSKFTKRN